MGLRPEIEGVWVHPLSLSPRVIGVLDILDDIERRVAQAERNVLMLGALSEYLLQMGVGVSVVPPSPVN